VVPFIYYSAPVNGFNEILTQSGDLASGCIAISKALEDSDPIFKGHYPNAPIYPGVLLIEAAIQAVRHFCVKQNVEVRLSQLDRSRFLAPVFPGDTYVVSCELKSRSDGHVDVSAICSTRKNPGDKAAAFKLVFEVVA
jgi:3-hydroxyacyl-[acyl-carrier-protein] dehydratase